MAPSYRSEVIGSLLRPDYLKEARKRFEDGALSTADFKRVEDRAVNEAIDRRGDRRRIVGHGVSCLSIGRP